MPSGLTGQCSLTLQNAILTLHMAIFAKSWRLILHISSINRIRIIAICNVNQLATQTRKAFIMPRKTNKKAASRGLAYSVNTNYGRIVQNVSDVLAGLADTESDKALFLTDALCVLTGKTLPYIIRRHDVPTFVRDKANTRPECLTTERWEKPIAMINAVGAERDNVRFGDDFSKMSFDEQVRWASLALPSERIRFVAKRMSGSKKQRRWLAECGL